MTEVVYIDGQYCAKADAKISVFDHGLLYGDGVFEGIRLYSGNIFRLDQHLDRLWDSAKAIILEIPNTKEEIAEIVAETCRRNGLTSGYIRLIITRGNGDLGLSPFNCPKASVICIAANIKMYDQKYYEEGLTIITSASRRVAPDTFSARVKSLNYLNNIMAKISALETKMGEALMLNGEGYVIEASGDNIFIIKNGVLFTPPAYMGALRGITQDAVIDIAVESGYTVTREPFTLYEVYTADEVFLTGTAAEVIPVRRIDGRNIGPFGDPGPITRELIEKFHTITKTQGHKI
ncbi:MAG: branched-chain-amino-acid transaminase [Sumerlaeia bacterium]